MIIFLLLPVAFCCNAPYARSLRPTGSDGEIFVVDVNGLPVGDALAFNTLAGAVARDTPKFFSVDTKINGDAYSDLWMPLLQNDTGLTFNRTFASDAVSAVLAFREKYIAGLVICDVNDPASVNAAVTMCSALDSQSGRAVIAACVGNGAVLAEKLQQLGVPVTADMRGKSELQGYQEARAKGNLSSRIITFQPASKAPFLTQFSVFSRAPLLEFTSASGGGPAAQAALSDMSKSGSCGAAFGWGPDEQTYIKQLARFGVFSHASDWAMDLVPLMNAPPPRRTLQESRQEEESIVNNAQEEDENVHTVTFVMTDGDNIQWLLGSFFSSETWYGSHSRGEAPIGWTLSPALQALAPSILEYTYRTASPRDSFVAAPSGIGYTYLEAMQGLSEYVQLTNSFMQASNMSILNVIGFSDKTPVLSPMMSQPGIKALIYYTFDDGYSGERGRMWSVDKKPVIGARVSLWGNSTSGLMLGVEPLVEFLKRQPKTTKSASGYSLIPVHAWSHSYDDVLRAVNLLNAAPGFRVLHTSDFVDAIIRNIPNL